MNNYGIPEVLLMKSAQLIIFPTPTSAPAITRYRVPISFEALGLTWTRGIPFEGGALFPLIRYTQDINVHINTWIMDNAESWSWRETEAIFLQTVLLWCIFEHSSEFIELRGGSWAQLAANALPICKWSREKGEAREEGVMSLLTQCLAGNEISQGQWYWIYPIMVTKCLTDAISTLGN